MSDIISRTMAVSDGQLVNPFTVTHKDGVFRVATIAHALGNLCRYGGHAKRFYSVAEHCLAMDAVIVSRYFNVWPYELLRLRREALVHDAAEAYLIDLPAPIKRSEGFEAYRAADERLARELRLWFGLSEEESDVIKALDVEIRGTERAQLFPPGIGVWQTSTPIPGLEVGIYSPRDAARIWIETFIELWPDWALSDSRMGVLP